LKNRKCVHTWANNTCCTSDHEKHKSYRNLVSTFTMVWCLGLNIRVIRILCLCSSAVVWLLGISSRKEANMRQRMIPRKKGWKCIRGWSLGPYFLALMALHMNSLAPELIGPQINNILLITWDQTMSQEMLKISIIGSKILWPWHLV
jgi:hypothetical protein